MLACLFRLLDNYYNSSHRNNAKNYNNIIVPITSDTKKDDDQTKPMITIEEHTPLNS